MKKQMAAQTALPKHSAGSAAEEGEEIRLSRKAKKRLRREAEKKKATPAAQAVASATDVRKFRTVFQHSCGF